MGYYSAIKKNEVMPLAATWLDLEVIVLNEVSWTKTDRYHMISLIHRLFKDYTVSESYNIFKCKVNVFGFAGQLEIYNTEKKILL